MVELSVFHSVYFDFNIDFDVGTYLKFVIVECRDYMLVHIMVHLNVRYDALEPVVLRKKIVCFQRYMSPQHTNCV